MSATEAVSRVAQLAKSAGVRRPRDAAHGIARRYLTLAEKSGAVVRSGRGRYTPANASVTELHSFAEAAKRAPRGVICLLSALRFHDNRDTRPVRDLDRYRRPRSDYPQMRVVRFSRLSLEFGQEIHDIEGVPTRAFSIAKTVADCFKYRNKLGLDVALEALPKCAE